MQRLSHEQATMQEKIRDNGEKIKQNKVLPYLVGNVVEVRTNLQSFTTRYAHSTRPTTKILDVDPDGEEDGASQDLDSQRKGKCAVIKTSTRQVSSLRL